MLQRNAPRLPAMMLIALALSSTGCASNSVPPVADCPANPPAPALSQPMPAVSYSLSVQASFKAWREKLTGTQPTQ